MDGDGDVLVVVLLLWPTMVLMMRSGSGGLGGVG